MSHHLQKRTFLFFSIPHHHHRPIAPPLVVPTLTPSHSSRPPIFATRLLTKQLSMSCTDDGRTAAAAAASPAAGRTYEVYIYLIGHKHKVHYYTRQSHSDKKRTGCHHRSQHPPIQPCHPRRHPRVWPKTQLSSAARDARVFLTPGLLPSRP